MREALRSGSPARRARTVAAHALNSSAAAPCTVALRAYRPRDAIAADADPEVRLLAARAELARGDARAARALVSDLKSPDALEIYAKALTRLGEISLAGEAWRSAGFADEALRLSIWERDWTAVSLGAVGPWKDAALLAVSAETATPPPDGLLAQGAALVDASAEARKRITDLLGSVVDPTSVP